MARFLSRRTFLLTGAAIGGTALIAAVGGAGFLASVDVDGPNPYVEVDRAVLNAFLSIHDDGRIVIQVPRAEMGQGIHTGLAMLVAEELDVPFDDRITVEHPVKLLPVYANWSNAVGVRPEEARGIMAWIGQRAISAVPLIATGGSGSTMGLWSPMRRAGAVARQLLLAAAALRLGVPVEELTTADAAVHHARSGRSLDYAGLARDAAAMRAPSDPVLKPRSEWRLIGRSQKRVDLPAKVRGQPVFGADVVLPDMLHATIRQAPVFGAGVARIVNEAAIRALPGVVDVASIDGRAVGVVAGSWWDAEVAARQLEIEWTATDADAVSSASLRERLWAALDDPEPHVHLEDGAAFPADAPTVIEATFEVPFVTHACMEPMNATVVVRPDRTAEAWVPSQSHTFAVNGVRRGAGWGDVNVSDVTCHITLNGGAFGRRSDMDVTAQAAFLATRHPGRPVKLMWPREEDISRGMFRSHAAARLRAALGPDGMPLAYDALVAAQSIMQSVGSRNLPITPGPHGDRLTIEGLDKSHYALPGRRVRSVHVPSHLPVAFWRSNGFSFGTFFSESLIDECAAAARIDPVEYRRRLLRDSPRHLAVLDKVAAMSNWGAPMGPGQGRGVAIESCYESVVAQVAEVTVAPDGELTVDRMFCAIDVGILINPDAVVAQMEGGIIFGLTTTLMNALTVENGAIRETNFHDFPMQRLHNAPEIHVEILRSDLPPGGAGEPGIVPVAGAVANAIFAATGQRPRSLPFAVTETIGERRTRTVLRGAGA
jgi:isoquinoline 1-oxidoreductase beta subunit